MHYTISTAAPGHHRPVWNGLYDELARDRVLYLIARFYLIGGWVVFAVLGKTDQYLPLIYSWIWVGAAIQGALIYILAVHVPRAIRSGSRRPLTDAMKTALQRIAAPRLLSGLILLFVNAVFWGVFSSIKNLLPQLFPLWIDLAIADLDFVIHGGHDPWRLLHPLVGYHAVTRVIEILYLNLWFLVLVAFPVCLAFRRDTDGLRIRYFATSFLILIVLGNGLAAAGMSAGPVYYGHVTGDVGRFSELVAYLSFSKGQVSSAADLQDQLWRLFTMNRTHVGSGISAYPSIHVAMATLFALAGWRLDRKLGVALCFYLVIVMIGSVHLGWHYALDGYASIMGVYAIWHVIGALQRRSALAAGSAAAA